jgi:hypothetical protein
MLQKYVTNRTDLNDYILLKNDKSHTKKFIPPLILGLNNNNKISI